MRALLAVVIAGHAIGHVLFMPFAFSVMRIPASGHSWLVTGALGEGLTHVIATALALVAMGLFAAAAFGVWTQAGWWWPIAIGGAVLSLVLIVVFWDGLLASPALAAAAFNVLALVALLLFRWPDQSLVGG